MSKRKSKTVEERMCDMSIQIEEQLSQVNRRVFKLIDAYDKVLEEREDALRETWEDREEAVKLIKAIVKAGIIQPIRSKDFALLKSAQLFTLQYIGERRRRHGRSTPTK
jgi:hypothetical protein